MASRTAVTNGTKRRKPAPKTVAAKRSGRRESWKKILERNLILEGISPVEAKELVALAAE